MLQIAELVAGSGILLMVCAGISFAMGRGFENDPKHRRREARRAQAMVARWQIRIGGLLVLVAILFLLVGLVI
jgi:hypothetical protein